MKDWIEEYISLGWKLCATRPGEKGPYLHGWGHLDLDASHWRARPNDGVGVILGRSGLATIDIDDMDASRAALAALGIDLDALLGASDAVQIVSREGRGKLVYRVREDQAAHVNRKRALNWKTKDGGSFCVVEFRAGSEQLQDVLPPSVHPVTGKPYVWRGDFRSVPTLPDELAAVWEDWETARAVMVDADPNRARVSTVRPKREINFADRGEGGDVIGKFNDAWDIWDVMRRPALQALYDEVGSRWRRKGSEDKAGVVALECRETPGRHRVYSHHGGDPLIPYTSTDAFGLYCLAEHGGDYRAAVGAAAFELGLPSLEVEAVGEEQVQALIASVGGGAVAVAAPRRGELISFPSYSLPDEAAPEPEDIAQPPGALAGRRLPVDEAQELAAWIAGRVGAAKIGPTIQATLATIGHLASRRYEREDGRRPNGFFAVLDSATLNLAPYLRAVDDFLDIMGDYEGGSERGRVRYLDERLDDVSTPTAMKEGYRNAARLLFGSPSFATWLEREGKQINPSFRLLLDEIGWYRLGKTLQFKPPKGDAWTVRATALSSLWAIAPGAVGGLVRSTRGSGLLQQTLVADSLDERAIATPRRAGVPIAARDRLRVIAGTIVRPGEDMVRDDWSHHAPRIVPVDKAALDIALDLKDRIGRSVGDSDRLRDFPLGGCARGWMEASESISLSLACIRDPEAPRVTSDLAEWSASWVWDCWNLILDRLGRAREDSADLERAILEVLRRAGADGASTMQLRDSARGLRGMNADKRDEILGSLEADGLILRRRQRGGSRYFLAAK